MVAVPFSLLVQGHNKEIFGFQYLQQFMSVVAIQKGIAKIGIQAIQHRGAEQKVTHRFRLLVQHRGRQIISHIFDISGKSMNKGFLVIGFFQR